MSYASMRACCGEPHHGDLCRPLPEWRTISCANSHHMNCGGMVDQLVDEPHECECWCHPVRALLDARYQREKGEADG